MFEFDAGKLFIIGIVALIVIGPKELPRVLRQVGHAVAKLRRMAADFQGQFMEAMREAELADLESEAAKLAASAKIGSVVDPVTTLQAEMTRAIEGSRENAAAAMPDPAATEPRPSIPVSAPGIEGPPSGEESSDEFPPKAEVAQDAAPRTA